MSGSSSGRVAFFVSDHGFGHGVRSAQLIGRLPGACAVTVYSGLPRSFFARELARPFELVDCRLDVGCVQHDALSVDVAATYEAYAAIDSRREPLLDDIAARLERDGTRVVVGDVPPLAFAAARRAGIPSLAVSNFTWCEIYGEYVDLDARFAGLIPRVRADYAAADLYAKLWPGLDAHPFSRAEEVGLLSRSPRRDRAWLAAHLGLDAARPWCLVYLGSYGIGGIDWRRLARIADWEFLGLYPLAGAPGNYHCITPSPAFAHADLSACCDVVLGKLGYGLVSECLHLGRAIVFPPRAMFREHAALAAAMVSRGLGREITLEDLRALRLAPALDWGRGARGAPLEAHAGERIAALISELGGLGVS